jgi:hypothetical protein
VTWTLYLPLVAPAVLSAAARPLAARIEPRHATWLLTAAAVALAACSMIALALLAAYAAARAPLLAAAGDYSQQVMRRGDPVSVAAGVAAALALTSAGGAVTWMFRHRARATLESYRRAARMSATDGIVVLPDADIEAYALPGLPGRIVVSIGLLACLDDRGRAALIAHESAHLSGRHHLFTSVARLAAAANPLLIPTVRAIDYTVERWADERAAAETRDRRLVAMTIGRIALLSRAPSPRRAIIALGILGRCYLQSSLLLAGPVPRRVAAMLGAPPRRHAALVAICTTLVLFAAVAALLAARDLHSLLELAEGATE